MLPSQRLHLLVFVLFAVAPTLFMAQGVSQDCVAVAKVSRASYQTCNETEVPIDDETVACRTTATSRLPFPTEKPTKWLIAFIGHSYWSWWDTACIHWANVAFNTWANTTNSTVQFARIGYTSNENFPISLENYDQIWVLDFSVAADNSLSQLQTYQQIADWYLAKGKPDLIMDARLLSSCWAGVGSTIDQNLIENYFYHFHARGGGLLLGTDDEARQFFSGINNLASNLNITGFCCTFDTTKTSVNISHPILAEPRVAYIDAGDDSDPRYYLSSNSSSGGVPIGMQANGKVLVPFGWDYSADALPTMSSTIPYHIPMIVSITRPACNVSFNDCGEILFESQLDPSFPGAPPYSYLWSSSISGELHSESSGYQSLPSGAHTITLRIADAHGYAAVAKVAILCGGSTIPILCGGSTIPSIDGYICGADGNWISPGTIDIPPGATLSVNKTVYVSGNLTIAGVAEIGLNSRIVVSGCAQVSGVLLVRLTPQEAAELIDGQRVSILSSNAACSDMGSFSAIQIESEAIDSCRDISVSQDTQPSRVDLLFSIQTSSECDDEFAGVPSWAIAVAVVAAVVVLVAVLLLLAFLVKPIRKKLFPFVNRAQAGDTVAK